MKNRVLILCTGNSARSQMAEGILRRDGGGALEVESAGLNPGGVRPEAIEVMREIGTIGFLTLFAPHDIRHRINPTMSDMAIHQSLSAYPPCSQLLTEHMDLQARHLPMFMTPT